MGVSISLNKHGHPQKCFAHRLGLASVRETKADMFPAVAPHVRVGDDFKTYFPFRVVLKDACRYFQQIFH